VISSFEVTSTPPISHPQRMMGRRRIAANLEVLGAFLLLASAASWQSARPIASRPTRVQSTSESHNDVSLVDLAPSNQTIGSELSQRPPCYYRTPNNRWRQRLELADLSVGQELQGVVVQEKLFGARTGPKIWLDVGVGRFKKDQWRICTAMMRLGYAKESVAKKKVAKLRAKPTGFPVYVSRIRLDQDQLEVVQSADDLAQYTRQEALKSISSLSAGDEVTGTVTRIEDFGVFVAIDGYNRAGLLHIRRVADLYGTFIDKKKGLVEAGLERRARVKLQVAEAVDKRRLFLDFTNDVKAEAAEEQRQKMEQEEAAREEIRARLREQRQAKSSSQSESSQLDVEVGGAPRVESFEPDKDDINGVVTDGATYEEEDDEEENYDSYDEQRDIEDALGLGTY
jgi:predicted RNA-binding protein with RPS1 domain